jgi:hypothetical protein
MIPQFICYGMTDEGKVVKIKSKAISITGRKSL